MSVTLSASAYTLPLLHAARHPASTVLGLLLARGAEIVEALPILHRYASLSLTIDTALRFVSAHAKDNGLTIAGVYIANEDGSMKVPRVAERLLETIRKENPNAIGLVVSRQPSSSVIITLPSSGSAVQLADGLYRVLHKGLCLPHMVMGDHEAAYVTTIADLSSTIRSSRRQNRSMCPLLRSPSPRRLSARGRFRL